MTDIPKPPVGPENRRIAEGEPPTVETRFSMSKYKIVEEGCRSFMVYKRDKFLFIPCWNKCLSKPSKKLAEEYIERMKEQELKENEPQKVWYYD